MSAFDDLLANRTRAAAQFAENSGASDDLVNALNQSADRQQYGNDGWTPEEIWNSSFNPVNIVQNYDYVDPGVAQAEPENTTINQQIPNIQYQAPQGSQFSQDQAQQKSQLKLSPVLKALTPVVPEISNLVNSSVSNNREIQKQDQPSTTLSNLKFSPVNISSSGVNNSNNLSNQSAVQQIIDEQTVRPQSVIVDNTKPSLIDQIIQQRMDESRELRPSIEQSNVDNQNDNQSDFEKEQQRKNEATKGIDQLQTLAQYGQLGMDPNDPMVKRALQEIDDGNTSSMASDAYRRFFDSEGNLEMNPLNWNLLGFSSQQKSSNATKDLYDSLFNNEEYQRDELERARNPYIPLTSNVVDRTMLDDGSAPWSREGIYMTGDQYLRYRNNLGIPGRDVNDIDKNEIYSKQDEMERYGFVPYIVSDSGLDRFHDNASKDKVNNTFNDIANFRRNNTDFTINYDGQAISGKDFIRQGKTWSQRNAGKEYEPVTDPGQVNEDSVPFTFVLTDSSGQTYKAPSSYYTGWRDEDTGNLYMLFGRDDGNGGVEYPTVNADGNWAFSDGQLGTQWRFDNEEDYRNSLTEDVASDGDPTFYWKNMEPLQLEDGSKLRADKAAFLLGDKENPNRYLQYSDFGDNNWNKPVIEDPFVDNNGNFNLNPTQNSFLPWITDVALGSVPYFFIPTSGAQGVSNAAASSTGFKPGYQDYINGTYSLISGNPTEEELLSSTVGSLALPVTEHLWGNLGGRFLTNPIMRAIGKNEEGLRPLVRYGMGAVGEGLEEIPGNVVEQFQQGSGITNWYADPMYRDEGGNLVTYDTGIEAYDNQGAPILNPNTDTINRLRNFGADVPLAFIGGATLGGSLGMSAIPSYRNDYNRYREEQNEFGNNLIRPDYNPDLRVGLTDEEREYYNSR